MAENKQGGIFRQKSLDALNGPENLDTEIRVTTPSVYLILLALAVLVGAAVAWYWLSFDVPNL